MPKRKRKLATANVTVCVPAGLRTRMTAAASRTMINWSSLAALAFEQHIRELEARESEGPRLAKAIERLQKLAREEGDDEFAFGHRAGEDWAYKSATPSALRRLARLAEDDLSDLLAGCTSESAFGPAECLAFAVLGEHQRNRAGAAEFWASTTDKKISNLSHDFLRGFVEGAVEAWDILRTHIE